MPSIFIWKAQAPVTSKRTIRYYSGDSWVLEDNEHSSQSYTILEQLVIPGSNNDSVIIYNAKKMPQDWVGSELLEVTQLPYQFIKQDEYGIVDQLGEWMRFTSKEEVQFDIQSLADEFVRIQSWAKKPFVKSTTHMNTNVHKTRHREDKPHDILNPERVKLNFQEFLIKYTTAQLQTNQPTPYKASQNTSKGHNNQRNSNTKFRQDRFKNRELVKAHNDN